MVHYVYILRSLKDGRLYVGETQDVMRRLWRHNEGLVKSTRNRKPFEIAAVRKVADKREGRQLERFLKSLEGSTLKRQLVDEGQIDI